MKEFEADVIVIGGGITGAGVARDCAMRGLKVLLVEKQDFTNGATGRNHGLMHSGARYAVTDFESAKECITENMILRKIARHCVEETDGLFITLPEDDLAFQAKFVDACRAAGIRADIIDPTEARHLEPSVNPDLIGAVRVPDAAIDPFRLTMANLIDARQHGATVLNYHEVTGFILESGRVTGVEIKDCHTGEAMTAHAALVINAAGIWGHLLAKKAGVTVNMFPAKGTLLIFGHRVNNMVINRCRKPDNADILVPDDAVCVIGTTSDRVGYDEIDHLAVTPEEVETLITEGMKLAPALASTRILRAYAGVRPLVAADNDPTGRKTSRGIVLLDHETRDGLAGLITITGGKMMTYRMMAEMATDLACKKLGIDEKCKTADTPLPGSENFSDKDGDLVYQIASGRHGSMTPCAELDTPESRALVCECEHVTVGEMQFAVNEMHTLNLKNLRRRTRVSMGTCQGQLCVLRAAGVLCGMKGSAATDARHDLAESMQERWKGMKPVAWGDTLKEAQLSSYIYSGLYGLGHAVK